jgi:hypothetical protein
MWTCQKKKKKWCRLGQILEDIQGILAGFKWHEVVHAKRGANEAAHGLAKLASQNYVDKIWIEEVPSNIQHIVNQERYALFVQSCFSRYFYMK